MISVILKGKKKKTLTTSTLCLPGGWGMEYLMKPWAGKGCSKREKEDWKSMNTTHLLDTSFISVCAYLCRVWSSCTRKSVRIKLGGKHQIIFIRKIIVTLSKLEVCIWENNILFPHCRHQGFQVVVETDQLQRGSSSEWMENHLKNVIPQCNIYYASYLHHKVEVVYVCHSFLTCKSKDIMHDYLGGRHLLSGACVMGQVMKEGL